MAERDAMVCLTFDFDAISAWPGMLGVTSPLVVSRREFAGRGAVPRVLDVLKREGVPATFFVPRITVEAWADLCRRIVDEGHEPSGVAKFGDEAELLEITGGAYTMCFHPEVIGRGARIRVLERMIARAREHRAQFMTAHAAAEHWISRDLFRHRASPRAQPTAEPPSAEGWSTGRRRSSDDAPRPPQ